MANNLTSNPVYVDSISGAADTTPAKLLGIIWVSNEESGLDIAADDDFEVQDSNGIIIACKRAEFTGDDFGVFFPKPFAVNGYSVTKLDGGVCLIYKE